MTTKRNPMKDERLVEMATFCSLVDAGSFTAAAHLLGTSQSFVSKSLKNLEQRLGVSLLHRTTRGQRLTVEGERYLASCRQVLDLVESSDDELMSQTNRASGSLRISAPLAFGTDRIVPIVPDFMDRHPDISISISLTDAIENLIDGHVDIAIRMGALSDSNLVSRKLCHLQRIVVATPDYLAAHPPLERPDDLKAHNCLLWEGANDHLNKWPFRDGEEESTIAMRGNLRSNNGMTLVAMCLQSRGVMRMAEHLALPLIRSGQLVEVLSAFNATDQQHINIVFLPERQSISRVRFFIDFCLEQFRKPAW
jgi:DNA-binding transcriptional LysR family regulator